LAASISEQTSLFSRIGNALGLRSLMGWPL